MADEIIHQSQPLTFDLTTSPAYKAGVADGYQRGLADAAKVCTQRADEIGEGSIGFTDVCVVIHRIRALADR